MVHSTRNCICASTHHEQNTLTASLQGSLFTTHEVGMHNVGISTGNTKRQLYIEQNATVTIGTDLISVSPE
jgi:hypothetical protein